MNTLQVITEDTVIQAIQNTQQRLVFIAPAVWPKVAQTIAEAWDRLGSESVTVILDVDAEVCRLGYGSQEGYTILQKAASLHGQTLGNEEGARICVVIADEQTLIFSPTPKLLESPPGDESTHSTTKPRTNGILLQTTPSSLCDETGVGPDKDLKRTIGLDSVSPKKLAEVATDLSNHPPKQFDLALAVNVYNAQIQFAELKITGCRISQHRATIPKVLGTIAKSNADLNAKIINSIRLLDDNQKVLTGEYSEESIEKLRAEIEKEFFIHIPGGTVFKRSLRKELEEKVQKLNDHISKFGSDILKTLDEQYRKTAEDLSQELLPDVLRNIPEGWRFSLGDHPNQDKVKYRIEDALLRSFGDPSKKVSKMQASLTFKDVTYEQLTDPKFTTTIAEKFGLPTMEKFQAAKERELF